MIDHVHVRLAEAVLDRARRTDGPA
jgi:hypothetical protein